MSLFTPDDYLSSVVKIDHEALFDRGFRVIFLDIDNTLVPRDTHVLPDEIKAWVLRLKERGFRLCLLSNNWHSTVFAYALELDVPIVYKAMKPLPFAYLRAQKKVGWAKGEKILAVGDQIFTDVLGARLRGYHVVLVVPQTSKDLWYTLWFRKFERLLLGTKSPRE